MRDFLLSAPNAREFMGTSDIEDIEVEEVSNIRRIVMVCETALTGCSDMQ